MNSSEGLVYVLDDDVSIRKALSRLLKFHGSTFTSQRLESFDTVVGNSYGI